MLWQYLTLALFGAGFAAATVLLFVELYALASQRVQRPH
jgi:hypothetical protein